MGVSLPRTFMHTFLSGTDFAGAPPGNRTRECGGGGGKVPAALMDVHSIKVTHEV